MQAFVQKRLSFCSFLIEHLLGSDPNRILKAKLIMFPEDYFEQSVFLGTP